MGESIEHVIKEQQLEKFYIKRPYLIFYLVIGMHLLQLCFQL